MDVLETRQAAPRSAPPAPCHEVMEVMAAALQGRLVPEAWLERLLDRYEETQR